MSIESIKTWLEQYPFLYDNLKFMGIILLAVLVYLIAKKVLVHGIKKITATTKTDWDDILLNERLLRKLSIIAPLLLVHYFAFIVPQFEITVERLSEALIALVILLSAGSLITSITEIYQSSPKFREKPIKGYGQVVKIIL